MSDEVVADTLALVPDGMQPHMAELRAATPGPLRLCATVQELVCESAERIYAVALIPSTGFLPEEWWTTWGCLNDMEPRPSVLIYALRSDFEMWTSVLESGGFDVIVAPFTAEKLRKAIASAVAEFSRRNRKA